ncbi:hypothetical protein [Streptococcus thermophilus]|uniref:hypothetical protein n=1 Tax=Streptococcus thermophilus TaxID=1308 RepID=UPI00187E6664|nr:hypothetical protein [Streptococcus thermophilus]
MHKNNNINVTMGNKAIENTNPNRFVLFYDNENQMIDLTQDHFVFLKVYLYYYQIRYCLE